MKIKAAIPAAIIQGEITALIFIMRK